MYPNNKELKYIAINESSKGIGAIHKEAICHMAYATALDALGVTQYLTSEQIRKFTAKKTTLMQHDDMLHLEVRVPIKRDLHAYELMQKAQTEIQQNFADLLGIQIDQIDLIIDQVVF